LIDDANEWKCLRDDRNELAHNYEDEPEEMSESINIIYEKRCLLGSIYLNIKKYYDARV